MIRTPAEIFYNKVSLIYEYNKKSPLFLRKAGHELENKNAVRAAEILTAGIKIFPNYAAAYVLLAKAYTLTGSISEAAEALKKGCALIGSPKTYEYYLREISGTKQKSLFQYGNPHSFDDDSTSQEPELFSDIVPDTKEDTPVNSWSDLDLISNYEDKPFNDIEDRLEEIAKEISSVRLSEVVPSSQKKYDEELFADNHVIISETLAMIYAAQGEYKEAIQVYKKLIKKHPHKEGYYNEKINELLLQLE